MPTTPHPPSNGTPGSPHAAETLDLPLDAIRVAPGRQPVGDPAELAASLAEVGRMLQPLVVNRVGGNSNSNGKGGGEGKVGGRGGGAGYDLVAGLTRLEAARSLGWPTVPASVIEVDADTAELAELDENLARAELSAARRAALTWRRQQAYERKYPDARAGFAGAAAKHLKRAGTDASASATVALADPSAAAGPAAARLPRGFAADTGGRTGRSPRTVQLDARVGRELGEAVLGRLERTPLADSRSELLKLARIEPARRTAVLREVERGGHAKVSRAEAALARSRRLGVLRAHAAENRGVDGRDPPWRVVTGDCLDALAPAPGGNNAPAGVAPGTVRMVFADPPYDLGKDYGRGKADDRKGEAGYAEFTRQWVERCVPLLTPDGSLWVLVDHRCLRAALNAVADAGLHQRSVVFWPDPFAQYQKMNFTPGRFLVYAVKDARDFVFHPDAVAVPSKRQTEYADARADPAGRTPGGWWDDVPTLCGTFAERGTGVTQLPVALVERPVLACTDAGDLMLDPFGGEGTTAVAAVRHGRRAVLIEADAGRAERSRERLAAETPPVV